MSRSTAKSSRHAFRLLVLLLLLLPFFTACAQNGKFGIGSRIVEDEEVHAAPYNPANFRDLLVPSELVWNRSKSMIVNTDSYAGGVLYFSGRVDVDSLTDFFATTMARNNWKLVGSVKYRDVLLAYDKPHKTCTIIIQQSEMIRNTAEVQIHITDDLSKGKAASSPAPAVTTPFAF